MMFQHKLDFLVISASYWGGEEHCRQAVATALISCSLAISETRGWPAVSEGSDVTVSRYSHGWLNSSTLPDTLAEVYFMQSQIFHLTAELVTSPRLQMMKSVAALGWRVSTFFCSHPGHPG